MQAITLHSNLADSERAGQEIGSQVQQGLGGERADALIVFASSRHDYSKLLRAIDHACRPKIMVGSSSAGEFTTHAYEEGAVSAVALRSPDIVFNAGLGRGLRTDRRAAGREMVASFQGLNAHSHASRAALILTDALAGHAEDFVEQLTVLTAGTYRLFGGGAGDDANFSRTHVFYGTEAVPDAAVGLEILSSKPLGIGVHHSWRPGSPALRVTESDGMRLVSLNNVPAAEVFAQYAEKNGTVFNRNDPIPYFLHNVLGIVTPAGHKLRVPLAVHPDGSIQCAADVPTGAIVHIMSPASGSALAATTKALEQLEGHTPGVALFFDCVATRLRLGREFGFELEAVRKALGSAQYAGCNTYGQVARAEGQFSGFHNCTAIVAILPA